MDSRELQSFGLQLSLQENKARKLKTGQAAKLFVLSNDLIRRSFRPAIIMSEEFSLISNMILNFFQTFPDSSIFGADEN